MPSILSLLQLQPRRRVLSAASSGLESVEAYESRLLLSAKGIATVPEAADVSTSQKVSAAAKTPADFSGHHDLNGTLGPGTMDVIQNGSNVTLTVNFVEEPAITNVPLEGTVKGNKLKATLATTPYDGLRKVVFKAKLNGEDLSWRISWKNA